MGVKKPPGGGLWRVELGGGVSARLRKSGEGLKVKLSDAGVKNLPANIEQQNWRRQPGFLLRDFAACESSCGDPSGVSSAVVELITEPPTPTSSARSTPIR